MFGEVMLPNGVSIGATAGERLAAVLDRVARHAIGDGGQITALFDLREILVAGLRSTGGKEQRRSARYECGYGPAFSHRSAAPDF